METHLCQGETNVSFIMRFLYVFADKPTHQHYAS